LLSKPWMCTTKRHDGLPLQREGTVAEMIFNLKQ
jgi:hypothetical protein